jgi:hypothetical protein
VPHLYRPHSFPARPCACMRVHRLESLGMQASTHLSWNTSWRAASTAHVQAPQVEPVSASAKDTDTDTDTGDTGPSTRIDNGRDRDRDSDSAIARNRERSTDLPRRDVSPPCCMTLRPDNTTRPAQQIKSGLPLYPAMTTLAFASARMSTLRFAANSWHGQTNMQTCAGHSAARCSATRVVASVSRQKGSG